MIIRTVCEICLTDPHGCSQVQRDIQGLMDKGELLVTKKSEGVSGIVPEFNVADHLETLVQKMHFKSVKNGLLSRFRTSLNS
jgi:hypothetical protein